LEGFSRQEQGKDGGIAPFFLLLGTTGNGPDAGRMKGTFPPDNRDYKYRNKMMKKNDFSHSFNLPVSHTG
jgi:hypothetical protein